MYGARCDRDGKLSRRAVRARSSGPTVAAARFAEDDYRAGRRVVDARCVAVFTRAAYVTSSRENFDARSLPPP